MRNRGHGGPLKVLFVCHNHPSIRPGGAEMYAFELFEALRSRPDVDAVFMAKGGPPIGRSGNVHMGTLVSPIDSDASQYFLFTDGYEFDWLNGTMTDPDFYTKHLRDFLRAHRPDVVHFQHTQFLGYPMIREVRNTLSDCAIVYTLHEFLPICHRDGQMLRTETDELCTHASPRRCHECFPSISPQAFFMRERFIRSHLSLVDAFLCPSRFLLERYVSWGIPRDRIHFLDNGRPEILPVAPTTGHTDRNRFAFFGQLSPFKGLYVLLRAMRLLQEGLVTYTMPRTAAPEDAEVCVEDVPPQLWVHGANLELQRSDFRAKIDELGDLLGNTVFTGKYERAQIPALMANVDWVVVPSIWWENAPLVIQEAFQCGRPVICSDIGGMAEKVTHGVNGLHFRAGDPTSLAQAMLVASSTPGLWEELRRGIPQVTTMESHIEELTAIYRSLMERRSDEERRYVG